MGKGLQVESMLVFRPKVVPDMAAMELLRKKLEAFSYVPQDGLHRDKIQPRRVPRTLDRASARLRAGSV